MDVAIGEVAPSRRELSSEMIAAAQDYGQAHGISGALDPADYLFWYVFDANRGLGPKAAVEAYLESGIHAARLLANLLDEPRVKEITNQRPSPGQKLSVLEFAAGYGRVTRHFASVLPGANVVACDIHEKAVAFLREMGCEAQLSSHAPEHLDVGKTFNVIYAFSFFTHMPRSTWRPWLVALTKHLSKNGVLIFTAHGEVSQGLMGVPNLEDDGFFFLKASEQADLAATEYGNTVTSFDYVFAQLRELDLKLVQFKQAGAGHHDVYVLHRRSDFVRYEDLEFRSLAAENRQLRETNQKLVATVESLYGSTSWKITGPLRAIARPLRR
jgi:SAM-dependent methyltransferase